MQSTQKDFVLTLIEQKLLYGIRLQQGYRFDQDPSSEVCGDCLIKNYLNAIRENAFKLFPWSWGGPSISSEAARCSTLNSTSCWGCWFQPRSWWRGLLLKKDHWHMSLITTWLTCSSHADLNEKSSRRIAEASLTWEKIVTDYEKVLKVRNAENIIFHAGAEIWCRQGVVGAIMVW